MTVTQDATPPARKSPRFGVFSQVAVATVLGLLAGLLDPAFAEQTRWLSALFLRLIVMAVGPLLFCIIVTGIVSAGSLRTVGRLGLRALLYFEVMTTAVLLLAVGAALLIHPGAGVDFHATEADAQAVASFAGNAHLLHNGGVTGFLMALVPRSPVSAFVDANILQILVFAILFGCCLAQIGPAGAPLIKLTDSLTALFSRMMRYIIATAPLGVFGAVASTTAQYGLEAIESLAAFVLIYCVAITVFMVVVLGGCLLACGINPLRFMRYLREEIVIVAATTSSDSVLPSVMAKLERMGVSRQVVGLVTPAGYSFNLDALSIYLGFAVVFLAEATHTPLGWGQMFAMLATALITSKGAHGVPGVAIVVLAATLGAAPSIPVASLVLLLAVDWFVGIPRSVGNLIGNCVAPVVIAAWEGALDREQARRTLGDA
ncbi:cation:dicarboxylase symporter family transporter [Acetobacter sacchari]|uniref:Cation:dicarboxylase symporter family transporter n=1 Tax=Acetobacter sacchari TaxID=2661687 RepID=A0ABS3LR06_9PROT|nr:cation:dicarboxylase symporter family transporter [Acetobacter sacchari]MBO1358334.1 cation:dicarboxylase symporter family transporter [Acetobacter sacchari]